MSKSSMSEEDAPSSDDSRGPHSPPGTSSPLGHTHAGLPLVLPLTLCRLDREADFRGGVFFGLNVFPKRGIFGLTKERSMFPVLGRNKAWAQAVE